MNSHVLAIDLGGTNTKIGILTPDLKIIRETVVPTNAKSGAEAAARSWLEAIAPWAQFKIERVGIGSPGPLDTEKGVILETPNLKNWAGFSFTNFMSKNLKAPCFIENDANCAALGEWHYHQRIDDLVMITLGTGVGSGVISGGKLVRGVKGLAVEAGHMTIDMNGPPCACGKRGCFEAFVGARSLVSLYNKKSKDKLADLNAAEVFSRAKIGDPVAVEMVDLWTRSLAVGIGNLVNLFNPSLVTLTGGVSRAFVDVESGFKKILLTQAFEEGLKWSKVVVSGLQEKAGLYGAAIWALQQNI